MAPVTKYIALLLLSRLGQTIPAPEVDAGTALEARSLEGRAITCQAAKEPLCRDSDVEGAIEYLRSGGDRERTDYSDAYRLITIKNACYVFGKAGNGKANVTATYNAIADSIQELYTKCKPVAGNRTGGDTTVKNKPNYLLQLRGEIKTGQP